MPGFGPKLAKVLSGPVWSLPVDNAIGVVGPAAVGVYCARAFAT